MTEKLREQEWGGAGTRVIRLPGAVRKDETVGVVGVKNRDMPLEALGHALSKRWPGNERPR